MNVENKLLFNEYLEEEKLAGHTRQGFKALQVRVPKLFVFLEELDYSVSGLRVRQAQEYQGWLIKTGRKDGGKYKSNTIIAFMIAAVSFYEFAKRRGLVPSNPFKEIRKTKQCRKLPRNLLKEKETNTILEKLCQFEEENHLSNKMSRFRVYLAVELIYSTGMRINEVAALVLSDINFQNRTIMVREGKGGRSRTAWLNDYTTDILEFYIEHLRSLMLTDHQLKTNSLFGIGKDFLSHLVNRYLGKVSEQAGLPPVTAHSFRHILGYHLLRAGCNIRYIQEILGHKLLRNTEIYTKVEKEDLKDVLDTYHPRKFKRLRNAKIIA